VLFFLFFSVASNITAPRRRAPSSPWRDQVPPGSAYSAAMTQCLENLLSYGYSILLRSALLAAASEKPASTGRAKRRSHDSPTHGGQLAKLWSRRRAQWLGLAKARILQPRLLLLIDVCRWYWRRSFVRSSCPLRQPVSRDQLGTAVVLVRQSPGHNIALFLVDTPTHGKGRVLFGDGPGQDLLRGGCATNLLFGRSFLKAPPARSAE